MHRQDLNPLSGAFPARSVNRNGRFEPLHLQRQGGIAALLYIRHLRREERKRLRKWHQEVVFGGAVIGAKGNLVKELGFGFVAGPRFAGPLSDSLVEESALKKGKIPFPLRTRLGIQGCEQSRLTRGEIDLSDRGAIDQQ